MATVKVLFLEDEKESVEPVIARLLNLGSYTVDFEDFQQYEAAFKRFPPDIVVLDLFAGTPSEGGVAGARIFDRTIWAHCFCPVVVYSAQPGFFSDDRPAHPLVKIVQKGRDSEEKVLQAISELAPHAEALNGIKTSVAQQFGLALRDVAPYAFEASTANADADKRNAQIMRSGLRRLAAVFDELAAGQEPLASWEQYLVPPLGNDLRLGDILRLKSMPAEDPAGFRIVLTPSCDLATSLKRRAKVERILLARCIPIKNGIEETKLVNVKKNKLEERLVQWTLSQGYLETILPIPALPGRIPHMAAKLRDLELVSLDEFKEQFEVVASIDSPFRELVSWAYMQTGARPGLPDRDFAQWGKEIIESLTEGN